MGGSQSVQIPGGGTEGYHVLKVGDRPFTPHETLFDMQARFFQTNARIHSNLNILQVQDASPGQTAGLEAFFDFIVAINDTRLVSCQKVNLFKAGIASFLSFITS